MSWVIIRKADNAVLFETFNRKVVTALNTTKYKAVEIQTYLADLNRRIKEGEI